MQQRDYSLQVTLDDRRCQMKSTSGSEMEKKERQCKRGWSQQEDIRQKFIIKNTISEGIKEELTRTGQLQMMKRLKLNLLTR